MGSRVELFASTRRDARVEEASIRDLARRHHMARKTVRKALSSPVLPERKAPKRSSPRLDPFFEGGCPFLSRAVTEPRAGEAAEAVSAAKDAFVHWCQLLSGSLRAHGTPADTTEALALLIVTSMEGSVAMCRAERSPRALEVIARTLEQLTENALDQGTSMTVNPPLAHPHPRP